MSAHQTQQNVNGVDVNGLFDTIGEIRANPDLAKFNFRATNKWLGADHNRSTIKDFYGAGKEDTITARASSTLS